jgi:trehalose/maltose transport system permease protein
MTATVFAWVLAWNEYLFALTFTYSDAEKTLLIRLAWYQGAGIGMEIWGPMQVEAVLYSLPVIIPIFWLQRYLAEGITASAVKG